MPTISANKDKSNSDNARSQANSSMATRPNTRRTGPPSLIEDHQDVKDSVEGRKYLEKHSLLCPPGEPASHPSLVACLHQISAMSGLPKPAINAIRSVAFLLDEMEEIQVHDTIRIALDSQMTEFTSDMKLLIEDAKAKINDHVKSSEERLAMSTQTVTTPTRNPGTSYASVLFNPPAHANPRVAAKEGIKARQFLLEGLKNSKFSHLDTIQLKSELNKILLDIGLSSGKIRTVSSSRGGGTVIEADNDEATHWLSNNTNQRKLCDKIGPNAEFRHRSFNIIAFNVPLAINPDEAGHRSEICETNGMEPDTITTAKWAKAIERRSLNQRSAHLLLTFNNADAANRAITNGLSICNRRCRVERTKREPIRCLKCQGWNHFAKDCIEERDSCGSCAGPHRTANCLDPTKNCVSCKITGHSSWDRNCPSFQKKLTEFNLRNPENALQYFPTADSWTWTASDRPLAPSPLPQMPRPQPTKLNQHEKRPQQPRKQGDIYIPHDAYVPDYPPDWDWSKNPGPSDVGLPNPSQKERGNITNNTPAPPPTATSNSNSNSNPNPNVNRPSNSIPTNA
jgi:hypothetical protein